jgi:translation elongation factor EF-Ts
VKIFKLFHIRSIIQKILFLLAYLHNKYNSSCSKIASIVEISTDNVSKTIDIIDQLKVLAMQVSAMKPLSLDKESLEKKVLDDETDIILKQIENTPEEQERANITR